MIRNLYTICIVLFGLDLSAQTQATHTFYTAAAGDGHGQKMAHIAVLGLDPGAVLSFDGSQLKVRANATLSDQDLLSALNSTNTGVYNVGPRPVRIPEMAAMPVRINTGDPSGDDARYAAAKQAWVTAHPDAYEQMMAPATSPALQPIKQH